MRRTIDIELQLQPELEHAPVTRDEMYKQACSGDGVTMSTWRDIWLANYQAAVKKFGKLGEKSYGQLHGLNRHGPMICLASGPSLKNSTEALRKNKTKKYPVKTISVLHNFGYLEDEGIGADYYLSLDAGEIIFDDFKEFGTKDEAWYWDQTAHRTLLASASSPPKLWEKWKGPIYLFHMLLPDLELRKKFTDIQPFHVYISSGGNAGGAIVYVAKALMGSATIMLCGYDFCFGYDHSFHPVKTKYDSFNGNGVGNVVRAVDIYGNSRISWPSYVNFKYWFDWLTQTIPGEWISCSEGILGAYRDGNLKSMKYLPLDTALERFWMTEEVRLMEVQNGQQQFRTLHTEQLFHDPEKGMELTLF